MEFKEYHVNHLYADTWGFSAAMVASCSPVFDNCDTNYEVRDLLKEAGIYTDKDEDDTE